ncbi:MAG: tetratricopeptide repeat protein [Desulfobacterales bacterium]|nr:tetratricopeptide repeat protein [Desulfobacterales bacterium]MCP4159616.1 tetratricopeptide repeat protein [Deltaproteobacteria bacterium]
MTEKKSPIEQAMDLANQGKVEEALGFVSENEEDGKKEYLISKLYFKAGNFQKGVASLEEAINKDRTYSTLWEKVGDDLVLLNKIEDALNAYERLYIEIPENSDILLKIGECNLALNNPEKAIDIFKAYININGEHEVALKRIAKAKSMLLKE